MEKFTLNIDPVKFRFTNEIWNRLNLNKRWSVGSVTDLIQSRKFQSKEEWQNFYYSSGRSRIQLLAKYSSEWKKKANNFRLIGKHLSEVPEEMKELNYQYGRTKKDLEKRARIMYEEIIRLKNPHKITLKECIEMVEYRIIGETWNGYVLRKQHTERKLTKLFPDLQFATSSAVHVDFDVFQNNQLVCGIQVKPLTFQYNFNPNAKLNQFLNNSYHKQYENEKNAPVVTIYADLKGRIQNDDFYSIIAKQAEAVALVK